MEPRCVDGCCGWCYGLVKVLFERKCAVEAEVKLPGGTGRCRRASGWMQMQMWILAALDLAYTVLRLVQFGRDDDRAEKFASWSSAWELSRAFARQGKVG